jgi:predicted Zn-dependent peptidase
MKQLQKLIVPALVLVVIVLVYSIYFSKGEDLGSFSDFDTNNSAVKDIRVQILQDKGINNNAFYVIDKTGEEVLVNADHLPPGIETAQTVVLRGHLNKDSFHAHDVLLD